MVARILHVLVAMKPGGAETMIMNLYREMDRSKVQFDFLLHSEEMGFYDQEIQQLGGRIFRLPYPNLRNMGNYRKRLFNIMSQNDWSAIHSHVHFFSGVILEEANRACMAVRIAHSHTTSDGKNTTMLRSLYRNYSRHKIMQNATHLLGCSTDACAALFGKHAARATVLKNSLRLKEYRENSQFSKSSIRTTLGLPADRIIIGHIGRLDPVKNHSFIIKAFGCFHKRNPDSILLLVGDGSEREKIQRLSAEMGLEASIILLRNRSDIPSIMGSLDAFIFPSLYEGLGNVVIEAQAAGLVCLVSEAIPKEADLQLNLVTFKSLGDGPDSWAEALERLIDINHTCWAQREAKLKWSGYDATTNAQEMLRLYTGE